MEFTIIDMQGCSIVPAQ